jgi:hypothetical protein
MIRHGVKPYLFVINNDGYEIERQIHGWTAKYNDIQLYDHQMLLPFLAGKKSKVSTEHSCSPTMHATVTLDLAADTRLPLPLSGPIREHRCAHPGRARGTAHQRSLCEGRQDPLGRGVHAPRGRAGGAYQAGKADGRGE